MKLVAFENRPGPSVSRSQHLTTRLHLASLVPLCVLALLASVWVTRATAHGVGVTHDSAAYVGIADTIRHGHAPTTPFAGVNTTLPLHSVIASSSRVPETHFPPGYPLAIAVLALFTRSSLASARLLGIVLAAVNVCLLGLLTARMTNFRSRVMPLLPPLLVVLVPDGSSKARELGWLPAHATAWSEPLFTALLVSSLLLLPPLMRDREGRGRAVERAAVVAGACLLVRYIGIVNVVVGVVALLLLDGRPIRTQLARAAKFGIIGLLPITVFLAWSRVLGAHSARVLHYHPLPRTWTLFIDYFAAYSFGSLWSQQTRRSLFLVLVIVVVVLLIWTPARVRRVWGRSNDRGRLVVRITAFYIVSYAVAAWIVRDFFDNALHVDARLLMPIRGVFYAVVLSVLYRVLVAYTAPAGATFLILAFLVAPVASSLGAQRHNLAAFRAVPRHATSVEQRLAATPRDSLIAASDPEQVFLAVHRSSVQLPMRVWYATGERNTHYASDVRELEASLRRRGGYVVSKPSLVDIAYGAVSVRDLRKAVRLDKVAGDKSEELYRAVPAAAASSASLPTPRLRPGPRTV